RPIFHVTKRILRTISGFLVYMLYASSSSRPSSTVLRDRFAFSVALYALGLLVRVIKLDYTCYIYVNVFHCNRTSVELYEERSLCVCAVTWFAPRVKQSGTSSSQAADDVSDRAIERCSIRSPVLAGFGQHVDIRYSRGVLLF
ncbi:unnamed protein product, partial [Ascophyllum nodosum]